MDDVQRALVAILNLFHQLAIAVAHDLHYAYPAEAHAEVLSWMQQHMPPPKPAE
ncbi:MAG: aminoglycoside 6-adenylyltransferase [Chloroflexota bacterium]|nr:aminoglycoside 6-adenylyltransferase [Chloroflexota bacterium]